MKLSLIQRMGGAAIIAGAALLTVWAVCWTTLLPVQERARDFTLLVQSPHWIWIASSALVALILLMFGFTAVYSRLHRHAGVSGFIGYVLITVAYFFQAAKVTWEAFVYPVIAGYGPAVPLFRDKLMMHHPQIALYRWLAGAAILLGVVLFSVTIIRSREFPRLSGILILTGAVIYAVGPIFNLYLAIMGVLILSAGCLLVGLRLSAPSPGSGF